MTPARDRVEAMVVKEAMKHITACHRQPLQFAIKMLRREHAAIVRAVKRLPRYKIELGEFLEYRHVLALLYARKHGHPRRAKLGDFFTGQLDEVRIFERALTPDEAKQIVQDKLTPRQRKKSAKALLAGRKGKP